MTQHTVPDPSKIVQVGLGFWASKTLLSAIKLKLFSRLSSGPMSAKQIKEALDLNPEGLYVLDYLDALYAMGFLNRTGLYQEALYSNTVDTETFLVENKPSYLGDFFVMANDREYLFWANLETGLKTGKPQNEIKETGKESFEAIYADTDRAKQFTDGMSGMQKGAFMQFVEQFDFSQHKVLLDVGGSAGIFSALVAQKHPHMKCITMDKPAIEPFVVQTLQSMNVSDQVEILSGNFFQDELPKADIVSMNNIINSFNLEVKKQLIKKSYDALPAGGKLIMIEMFLDENREKNALALLMSLNMLIESDGGYTYTHREFEQWAKEAGFKEVTFKTLEGPAELAIAIK